MFSKLVNGILRTNNKYNGRNHTIDRITPHYMEWYTSAKECCESFVPSSRRASANYCIGKDGEIWGNVDEENTAWTSRSRYNDGRAITIECACYTTSENYGVLPNVVWDSLVRLCVDICKRYGFRLNFTGDDSGNLTMHKWYDDTDCPGKWFSIQFDRLAKEVNSILDGYTPEPSPHPNPPLVFGGKYLIKVDGLNVRTKPSLDGDIVARYNCGDTVYLDDWYTSSNGYIWGRYIGFQSGKYRYIAIGRDTGKIENDDYAVRMN